MISPLVFIRHNQNMIYKNAIGAIQQRQRTHDMHTTRDVIIKIQALWMWYFCQFEDQFYRNVKNILVHV